MWKFLSGSAGRLSYWTGPSALADDGDSRLALVRGNMRNVRDIFSIRFATVPSAALRPVAEESGVSQDSSGANL